MGFYWSYMLLLKLPVLMLSCVLYKWVHRELVYHTVQKQHLAICLGPGTKLHVSILTDGANLLFDLIGHGLMKVLELHTQSKVSQLDGAVG